MTPTEMKDGLALYSIGTGNPVFLMPYPHASSQRSAADGRFAELIVSKGFRVLTFDPPSFARSDRPATATLDEMILCTKECLAHFSINRAIPFLGHSMGGFCAIALAIENPGLISSLLISGSPSGWKDVKKFSIHKKWNFFEKRFWISRYLGARIILNMANLKIFKQMENLSNYECFLDKSFFEELAIASEDTKLPPPPRAIWLRNVRNYEYSDKLHTIDVPVMIASGKYDPMVPLAVSEKMKKSIPGARITHFEKSGHSPFIEEKDKFGEMMKSFLK